jgi:DNA-binding LytR/AlgR family response regulator
MAVTRKKKPEAKLPRKPARKPPSTPPPVEPPLEKDVLALLYRLVSPLKSLPVQVTDGVAYIRPEEIAYLTTSPSRKILIYDLAGNEWQRFDQLNELEKKLQPDSRFFRSHNSFLINVFAVKALLRNPKSGSYTVTFRGQVKGSASVSDANLKNIRDLLEL